MGITSFLIDQAMPELVRSRARAEKPQLRIRGLAGGREVACMFAMLM